MSSPKLPSTATILEILVTYALQAPSSHNTQPWKFRLDEPSRVSVYADRSRRLPVNDPDDRELTMSCGAAIENLIIAAREFGFDVDVRVQPDPNDADLLAVVTLAEGNWPNDEEASLFVAIDRRRTTRDALSGGAVDVQLVRAMEAAAAAEGAWLASIDDHRRSQIAALVGDGDRRQFGDRHWRRELASWLHSTHDDDGLILPYGVSVLARAVIRSVDAGRPTASRDAALVEAAPILAVLGTDGDDARSWLAAGRALERVLLTAAFKGVQAGFLNQPCQVAELRAKLRGIVGRQGWPQALVRFGRPSTEIPASRRRSLISTLADGPERIDWDRRIASGDARRSSVLEDRHEGEQGSDGTG